MRIAMIASLAERVPPKKYGGAERVVYFLVEELVRRGHDVTLFASGDSQTSAKLESVFPVSLREAKVKDVYGLNEWNFLNFGKAYSMQDQFDVIHDHNYAISLPTANLSKTPVVMTVHSTFYEGNIALFKQFNNVNLVAISKAHAKSANSGINIIGSVYNGLEMKHYPFSKKHEGYLLFVGRMNKEKGVHHAIDVAEALNLPLIIAARIREDGGEGEREYFEKQIQPRLTDKIRFIGEVDEKERNELMSKALCMLHPTGFAEPFGLTLIESMACGSPVIAFDKGAIPEVIENGKTGFVVKNLEQMIAAVANVDKIDREYCRRYALDTFNIQRMADGYEQMYQRAINNAFLGQPLPFLGETKVPVYNGPGISIYNQVMNNHLVDKALVGSKRGSVLRKNKA
jgi:glycosyltransferase involved in cell wall biosynthesis